MKRIETIETRDLAMSAQNGGCGECQTSCQSACKTSCGVANQACENENKQNRALCPVRLDLMYRRCFFAYFQEYIVVYRIYIRIKKT